MHFFCGLSVTQHKGEAESYKRSSYYSQVSSAFGPYLHLFSIGEAGELKAEHRVHVWIGELDQTASNVWGTRRVQCGSEAWEILDHRQQWELPDTQHPQVLLTSQHDLHLSFKWSWQHTAPRVHLLDVRTTSLSAGSFKSVFLSCDDLGMGG